MHGRLSHSFMSLKRHNYKTIVAIYTFIKLANKVSQITIILNTCEGIDFVIKSGLQ